MLHLTDNHFNTHFQLYVQSDESILNRKKARTALISKASLSSYSAGFFVAGNDVRGDEEGDYRGRCPGGIKAKNNLFRRITGE